MTTSPRIAIVTGAAKGIGRTIALRLADDGLDVAVNDLEVQASNLNEVAEEIKAKGRRSMVYFTDVSYEANVRGFVNKVVETLGGLDVMIANAGISFGGSLLETTEEDWGRIMRVNARGTMVQYKVAAEQMIKHGRGGRIIGASSISGKRGFALVHAYSASKFAIRGLTQSTALELRKYGITVNAYAPGFIKTDMTVSEADADRGPGAAIMEIFGYPPDTPLGETKDVAELVSFLVKPEAQFITGQTIIVDGGVQFD